MNLTQGELIQQLEYDPETGLWRWKDLTRKKNRSWFKGNLVNGGYLQILIDRKAYSAHRLAWLYMTGSWPVHRQEIDHINNIKSDNRWSNLQSMTHSGNVKKAYTDKKERWLAKLESKPCA